MPGGVRCVIRLRRIPGLRIRVIGRIVVSEMPDEGDALQSGALSFHSD